MIYESENVQILWEQFNNLEVENMLHYTRVEILNKIIHICQEDEKRNIKKRLTWLGRYM